LPAEIQRVQSVNLLEEEEGILPNCSANKWEFDVAPFEIVTLKLFRE
jgi:hypothetical protein